ncbi:MAG: putative internalin [Deltaproteobacteria bacterium]|nr:putative internalin [Deltaproteobacteria bacterium]
MRILNTTIFALVACSVPSKQPLDQDAGADGAASSDAADEVAPDTTITSAPDEFSAEGAATFQFRSDDPMARFECSFDRETPVACMSPYTRLLGDGNHSFSVRAIDASGNGDDTPAEHQWTIDRVAPDTELIKKPPAADNSVMVRFTFRSAEKHVTFDCALDGGSYVSCESGDTIGPISDGTHSFAVRAKDRAGNIDASPAVYAWTVDTSTPDTQLLGGPEGPTGSTIATFTFVSPDAGSGATYQCSLDAAAFTACTSPRSFDNLGEREHTFAVRVRDAVGNFDPTPATRAWAVDLTPPSTTIASGPTGIVDMASASFTFSASEDAVTYACSVDVAPFIACSSPFTLGGLAQGDHVFAVRATDPAGHVDPTPASRGWTVDTVAPDITILSGPATPSGPRVVFGFAVSDGVATCSLDPAAFTACMSPIGFNVSAGPHEFRVRATDGAGNVTTVTRAWTVACSAPDETGAAGLLHLDDAGQTLVNAVAGGAAATLGNNATVEPGDPTLVEGGRFGGGLAFTPAESDHVDWPALLGPTTELTLELWARPRTPAGARNLLTTGDGRIALSVTAASPTTLRFAVAVVGDGPGPHTTSFVVGSAAVNADEWHHVLASLQGKALRLWVDGARTEISTVELTAPLLLDTVRLGGDAGTAYSGLLDEVWIAQTSITLDEAALARYCPL